MTRKPVKAKRKSVASRWYYVTEPDNSQPGNQKAKSDERMTTTDEDTPTEKEEKSRIIPDLFMSLALKVCIVSCGNLSLVCAGVGWRP